MAQLTWVFNNASGSDDWCSGAGPGNGLVPSGVPMSGVNASFSGSVVTLDGSPDLSTFNAATWGLWMRTVSGRQHFDLSAANNSTKTVTCVTAPSGLASGLQWAIGGKRQTIDSSDSRQLFTRDIKATWSFYFEDNQTITNVVTTYVAGGSNANHRFYGPSDKVTITQTANAAHFDYGAGSGSSYNGLFENLKFVNSNATKTSAVAINNTGTSHIRVKNCVFGDSTNKLQNGVKNSSTFSASSTATIEDCLFDSCTGAGFIQDGGNNNQHATVIGCIFKNCNNASTNNGAIQQASNNQIIVTDCNIYGGSKPGIYVGTAQYVTIKNCTIHGNTGAASDGILINAIGTTGQARVAILNNNITANGRYGISVPATNYYHSGGLMPQMLIDYNNYGAGVTANTSGARNNLTAGVHDLAVDPGYTDAANGDFSVGTTVKALAFPSTFPAGVMTSYVDIGSAQRQETSSSTLPITKSKYNEGFN